MILDKVKNQDWPFDQFKNVANDIMTSNIIVSVLFFGMLILVAWKIANRY